MTQGRNPYLTLTDDMKFTKETDDDVPFGESTDGSGISEGPQDGHPPLRTPPRPSQAGTSVPNASHAPQYSEETPDDHQVDLAVPSHLGPCPSPSGTSPERGTTTTQIPLESPHCEAIQERIIAGALKGGTPELELPSDMEISSSSNASLSGLKTLAEQHLSQSSEKANGPSIARQDFETPQVDDRTPHSLHLLKDEENTLHEDLSTLSKSDLVPAEPNILSERPKVTFTGDTSISSRKAGGVKRARSLEDELSANNPRSKKPRTLLGT
jgi:hypothetical protein